jgi:hypothetical protein
LKTDVNISLKSKEKKNLKNNLFLVAILKATDEREGTGRQWYGSAPKCHGSSKLPYTLYAVYLEVHIGNSTAQHLPEETFERN